MSAVDHEAAVAKLLADLGDTADAIADRLRALGIKGRARQACHCPVANYIERQSAYTGASVSRDLVLAVDPDLNYEALEVPTPDAVAEFVRRFDDGVYLDLVEVAG
jgi:hypothetical protein